MRLLLASLCLLIAGCSGKSVMFRVTDGETGEPVSGIRIDVDYRMMSVGDVPPMDTHGTTDRDGTVRLHVWNSKNLREFRATDPSNQFHLVPVSSPRPFGDRNSPDEMSYIAYRLPRPTIVVVIPNGYRGLIRVATDRTSAPPPLGKRHFEVEVDPPDITVPIAGVMAAGLFEYRFASGEPLRKLTYFEGSSEPHVVGLQVLPYQYRDTHFRLYLGTFAERIAFDPTR